MNYLLHPHTVEIDIGTNNSPSPSTGEGRGEGEKNSPPSFILPRTRLCRNYELRGRGQRSCKTEQAGG
jgi:hypothetical protein